MILDKTFIFPYEVRFAAAVTHCNGVGVGPGGEGASYASDAESLLTCTSQRGRPWCEARARGATAPAVALKLWLAYGHKSEVSTRLYLRLFVNSYGENS